MEDRPTLQETPDIIKIMKNDHRHILALFQVYLATEADSRQPLVDQILQRLHDHFDWEETLFGKDARLQGHAHGTAVLHRVLLEHEEVKAMMDEFNRAETDDDESMDRFFEDMMQTVRVHFQTEERDLIPLFDAVATSSEG